MLSPSCTRYVVRAFFFTVFFFTVGAAFEGVDACTAALDELDERNGVALASPPNSASVCWSKLDDALVDGR